MNISHNEILGIMEAGDTLKLAVQIRGVENINKGNILDNTLLHLAIQRNYVDVIEVLINAGADVNSINTQGMTPLHVACIRGHVECMSILLQNGACVRMEDNKGRTPLYVYMGSCPTSTTEGIEMLKKAGARM